MSVPRLAALGTKRSKGYTVQNVLRTNREGNPKEGEAGMPSRDTVNGLKKFLIPCF